MSMNFLSPGSFASTGGTAVPFQRIVEPNQLGLFLNLEQSELLRIQRYQEAWKFYIGQHWSFNREDGEPLVTLNVCKAVVDKTVSWLVGAGMTIKVPEAMKLHTLPVLDEVWNYNQRNQWLFDAATMGAVTGDTFALITYAEPTAMARRINPHTQGQIRIQLLSSEQVFPTWDPLNTDLLTQVRIETVYYDDRPQSIAGTSQGDNGVRQLATRRFSQIITPEKIIEQYQGESPIVKDNPLGEIPLVHIKNLSLPSEYYGMSDLQGIIDLNRELNEKATDVSDIINYHAAPVTVIQGAKVKNLDRSPRNIWSGLPDTAKVFNLNLETDLGASMEYIKMIKEQILEQAGIPEGSLGKTQPISNTSGVALHTQYQPLVEKIERKKAFFEPALDKINYFILRTKETTDPGFRMMTDLCKHCGGRIVELPQFNGAMVKRCYRINNQTFDFLRPEEVKMPYLRQHSFGNKVEEAEFKQIEAEHDQFAPSYWDPAPAESAEERRMSKAQERTDNVNAQAAGGAAEGTKPPELKPETPESPQMPPSSIELPPEPEVINIQRFYVNPTTGNFEDGGQEQREVIPTLCEQSEYLNPYYTETKLNDTLPKDKQLQVQLFKEYLGLKLVSKAWVRRQLPEIENVDQIEKEIDEETAREMAGLDPGIDGSVFSQPGDGAEAGPNLSGAPGVGTPGA